MSKGTFNVDGSCLQSANQKAEALPKNDSSWKTWINSFCDVMADENGRKLFRGFLEKEKKDEVLKFYYLCGAVPKAASQQEKHMLMNKIYKCFVQEKAFYLSIQIKQSLNEAVQNPENGDCNGVFDGARREAWTFMEVESYPRFIESEMYFSYISEQYALEAERTGNEDAPFVDTPTMSHQSSLSTTLLSPDIPKSVPNTTDSGLSLAATPQTPSQNFMEPRSENPPPLPPRMACNFSRPSSTGQIGPAAFSKPASSVRNTEDAPCYINVNTVTLKNPEISLNPYDKSFRKTNAPSPVTFAANLTAKLENLINPKASLKEIVAFAARTNQSRPGEDESEKALEDKVNDIWEQRTRSVSTGSSYGSSPVFRQPLPAATHSSLFSPQQSLLLPTIPPRTVSADIGSFVKHMDKKIMEAPQKNRDQVKPQPVYSVDPGQRLQNTRNYTAGYTTDSGVGLSGQSHVSMATSTDSRKSSRATEQTSASLVQEFLAKQAQQQRPSSSSMKEEPHVPVAPPSAFSAQARHKGGYAGSQQNKAPHKSSSVRSAQQRPVRRLEENLDGLTVLYRVGQLGDLFMTKMTGRNNLRNFKTQLPITISRHEKTRYFFKKDVPGVGVVFEEVFSDVDVLPLYESRITATIEN